MGVHCPIIATAEMIVISETEKKRRAQPSKRGCSELFFCVAFSHWFFQFSFVLCEEEEVQQRTD